AFVRAYVEGTLEGLRYARDNQEESLKIILKHKPELDPALTTLQLRNAVTEVFLPVESAQLGLGYIKPDIMETTVRVTNEYFDVGRKVTAKEVYTNQFIKRYRIRDLRPLSAAADCHPRRVQGFYRRREDRQRFGTGLLRNPQRRFCLHRRRQRLRQEHPAQNYFGTAAGNFRKRRD